MQLKELADLQKRLDEMDEDTIPVPDYPDMFAGRSDCVFMGTIGDVELRKLVVLTSDVMDELQNMLGDDLFPTTDGGQPMIQGLVSLATSLVSLLDGILRMRFKIADLYRPVVTEGWKLYSVPESRCGGCGGGCGGCGGGCGHETDEADGSDASEADADGDDDGSI